MCTRLAVLATCLLLPLPVTFSADNDDTGKPPPPDRPVFEEELLVPAEKPDSEKIPVDQLDTGVVDNLAVALLELPGVHGVRRSQSAVEPVIRGLGWERVQTEVNGLPLYGACPARMDPPATFFGVAAIQEVALMKGLPSVTAGPGGTGGRLELSTDFNRGPDAGREMTPWVQVAYDGARSGYVAGAGVNGGTAGLDYAVGVETVDMGDYETPDGRKVLSGQDETGLFSSLGWRQGDTGRLNVGHLRRDGGRVDFPSLPMDTETTDVSVTYAGYSYEPEPNGRRFLGLKFRAATGSTDHLMSNRWKPNRMMLQAATVSEANTASGAVDSHWWVGHDARLQAGIDWFQLDRDALRQRTIVMSGASFYDHLWPDVSQEDLGLYAEFTATPDNRLTVRAGVRHDRVSSSAAAADDPGIAAGTIRENFVRFYGDAAGITDRDERLFSGNVQAAVTGPEGWSFHAGVGQVSRAAGMTERYFAFAPSPGGFSVGNPALEAEVKGELSAGIRYDGSRISAGFTIYHDSVRDYIKPTVLEDRVNDWNGDGMPDRVSGFRNVDATLTGGELAGVIKAFQSLSFPVAIAWVRGEYDGLPLPEIPPLEGKLAARFSFAAERSGWVELAARMVARQDRVDPDFAVPVPPGFRENVTPGYAVLRLRAGIRLFGQLQLEAGVENLTDKLYHDHLSREVLMASGDLTPGSELIQPGRSFYTRARMSF
jgi:iron complex outermembrane receptor protein